MLGIEKVRDSNEFAVLPTSQQPWSIKSVPEDIRQELKQAKNKRDLLRGGRKLAKHVAPWKNAQIHHDLKKLILYLKSEEGLRTDDHRTPWELMAWGNHEHPSFWATEKPVVRVHGSQLTQRIAERSVSNKLIIVSDPDDDLALFLYEERIEALGGELLWNPTLKEVTDAIAEEHDLIIFIGHATYNPDEPETNKFYLSNNHHLTPSILRRHLDSHRQPVIIFIACTASQHNPEGQGLTATPATGFMPACLDVAAAAFIGPLWDIKVDGGLWIAERLLKHLEHPHPPGEAMRLTRRDALEETPHDTTWAAFVVYQRPPLRNFRPPVVQEATILEKSKKWRGIYHYAAGGLLLLVLGVVIGLWLVVPPIEPSLDASPTPTPISLDTLTFTVVCDGKEHSILPGETITLQLEQEILIELNISPSSSPNNVVSLEGETGKEFIYTADQLGKDTIDFVFADSFPGPLVIDVVEEPKACRP